MASNYEHTSQKVLDRKKSDPSKFIFTGQPHEHFSMQLFTYNPDDFIEIQDLNLKDLPDITQTDKINWLNIYGLSDTEKIVEICHKQGIHDLTIQDILDINQRPKFQEYEDYFFFTVKSSISDSFMNLVTEQISFVFGKNYLISFQEQKSDHFEHLRFRLRNKVGTVRDKAADYLLFVMLEAILDSYFTNLKNLENRIINFKIIDTKIEPSPQILNQLEKYKKEVSLIKRNIQPVRDFTLMAERQLINIIQTQNKKYYFELQDLCLTLNENCDSILSTLESKTNLFFSVQTHRMNQVIKTLTIVSSIFIPLTFIVGIYGMNFENMPEIKMKYGYFFVLGIMFLASLLMVLYFKKKKWF